MLRSILVPLNLSQVNGAIKLDNQATGRTAEICDEPSQWMLSSEFMAVQLMTAQACPQQCFSGGWIVPKFFGTLIDLGGSAANAGGTFDVWAHDECRESKRRVKYVGKYSENEGAGQTGSAIRPSPPRLRQPLPCGQPSRHYVDTGKRRGESARWNDAEGITCLNSKGTAGLRFRRNSLHVLPQPAVFITHAGIEILRQFQWQFQARDQLLHEGIGGHVVIIHLAILLGLP